MLGDALTLQEIFRERKIILAALLFMDGSKGKDAVRSFAEDNLVRFAATLSETSAVILKATDIGALYELGWHLGGLPFVVPLPSREAFAREKLVSILGEAMAHALVAELGPGCTVLIGNVISEFHNFYRRGFIVHLRCRGASVANLTTALGITKRQVFSEIRQEGQQRNPLKLDRAAPGFESYYQRCFEERLP